MSALQVTGNMTDDIPSQSCYYCKTPGLVN